MEMVAFLAGLLVFGLVKLVLIATVTRNDGAEGHAADLAWQRAASAGAGDQGRAP